MLKYYHKLNKIAIHSKKDFIFIFQASLICFRSRGKIYDSSFSGFKIAMAVCKAIGPDESVVDDSYCDPDNRPEKTLMPCNTHPCTAKWVLSWRLACVHVSKNVRSWIFVSKLRYFFFYKRTRGTLRFDKLFADFYARRGSRSLQKSSSIRGLILRMSGFLFISLPRSSLRKRIDPIYFHSRDRCLSMATIWNADDSIFYSYFLNIWYQRCFYYSINVRYEFFIYTLLNLQFAYNKLSQMYLLFSSLISISWIIPCWKCNVSSQTISSVGMYILVIQTSNIQLRCRGEFEPMAGNFIKAFLIAQPRDRAFRFYESRNVWLQEHVAARVLHVLHSWNRKHSHFWEINAGQSSVSRQFPRRGRGQSKQPVPIIVRQSVSVDGVYACVGIRWPM